MHDPMLRRSFLLSLGLVLAQLGGAMALRAAGMAVRRWLLPTVEVRALPVLLNDARIEAGPYVRTARPRYVDWRDDAALSRWVAAHLGDAEDAVGADALRRARERKDARDGPGGFHITLCGEWEKTAPSQTLSDEELDAFRDEAHRELSLADATPLGMGCLLEPEEPTAPGTANAAGVAPGNFALFVVVEWAALQALRARHGLPPSHPHVTVGFRDGDVHTRPKGRATLLPVRAVGTQRSESPQSPQSAGSCTPSGLSESLAGGGADCERALLNSPRELAAKINEEARRHAETGDDAGATHRPAAWSNCPYSQQPTR